jgi:predicted DNA-binding antitoxin AbrB/MazE fold protein
MNTQTVDAIYSHGVVKLRRKLPLREGTSLRLTISIPRSPVRRTRGIIRVHPRTARAIIASNSLASDP